MLTTGSTVTGIGMETGGGADEGGGGSGCCTSTGGGAATLVFFGVLSLFPGDFCASFFFQSIRYLLY